MLSNIKMNKITHFDSCVGVAQELLKLSECDLKKNTF